LCRAYFPEFPNKTICQWGEKHLYKMTYAGKHDIMGYRAGKEGVRYLRKSDEKVFQNILKLQEKNEELLAMRADDIDRGVVTAYNGICSQTLAYHEGEDDAET
jgi:hypothetical protein